MAKIITIILTVMLITACSSNEDKPLIEQIAPEPTQKVDVEKALSDIVSPVTIQDFLVLYDRYLEQSINSHMTVMNGQIDLDRYKFLNTISVMKISMLLSNLTKENVENYSDAFKLEASKLVNKGVILFTDINLMQEHNEAELKRFTMKIKEHRNDLLILSDNYEAGLSKESNIDIQLQFNSN